MIFVLISVFEMSRGMWIYHTMAYAIKEGTRFTIVHGKNCDHAVNTANSCQVTVGQIAQVIKKAGVGLDPGQLQVQMVSNTQTINMDFLSNLITSPTTFPLGDGGIQTSPITFTAQYPFFSALSMFWPGAGRGVQFQNLTCQSGTLCLAASSTDNVQF
jgi:hypothetical protein